MANLKAFWSIYLVWNIVGYIVYGTHFVVHVVPKGWVIGQAIDVISTAAKSRWVRQQLAGLLNK